MVLEIDIYDLLLKFYEQLKYHNRPWSEVEFAYIAAIEGVLLLVCLILMWKKKIHWYQSAAVLIFWMYYATVLQSCVFTRSWRPGTINLELFWSWKLAMAGDAYYFQQVFLNILLLMPVGFLLPFIFGRPCALWKSILIGFVLSLIIEGLQYEVGRGLFELDDLFDNTLGCVIGTAFVDIVWLLCRWIWRGIRRLFSRA